VQDVLTWVLRGLHGDLPAVKAGAEMAIGGGKEDIQADLDDFKDAIKMHDYVARLPQG
jgi:hypothetical protein